MDSFATLGRWGGSRQVAKRTSGVPAESLRPYEPRRGVPRAVGDLKSPAGPAGSQAPGERGRPELDARHRHLASSLGSLISGSCRGSPYQSK